MPQERIVKIEASPLNYKQLATLYNVSHKTLKSWLEPIEKELGPIRGQRFTIKQVQLIFDNIGEPKPRTA